MSEHILDELTWRGLIAQSTDPRRPAQGPRHRAAHAVLRIRPDRAEPAPRPPRADPHAAPLPEVRPPAAGPGRRRHRPDRRPAAHRGTAAQRARGGGRLGGAHPPPDRAAAGLHRPARRDHGQQPGLDGPAVRHRLPAGRRQALPGEPAAGQGSGQCPAQLGSGHQLHRVQLPTAAGQRLPGTAPPLRLHAADRRQRPVGQPDVRRRPDPPGHRQVRARPGHTAADQGRRHQVRQDGVRRDLAGSGA